MKFMYFLLFILFSSAAIGGNGSTVHRTVNPAAYQTLKITGYELEALQDAIARNKELHLQEHKLKPISLKGAQSRYLLEAIRLNQSEPVQSQFNLRVTD